MRGLLGSTSSIKGIYVELATSPDGRNDSSILVGVKLS